jgi:general nucleoside transport system ATP-binding protein
MNDSTVILDARGIVKRFGPLVANDVARFSVGGREIVALLGENGAGKSTLCKILYGYYRPDAGEISVAGRPVRIDSPEDARRLGIGMIFQNFSLIPALSVWENMALFLTDLPWTIGPGELRRRMARFAARLGLDIDLRLPVGRLAVGDRQKVEILKQLLAGARLLILDEPTKVLAPQEAEGLFKTLSELREEGYGLVLITHKLREVLACADRIAVMRHGRIVDTLVREEADEPTLLRLMFGEEAAATGATREQLGAKFGDRALRLDGIVTAAEPGAVPLRGVSLELHEGEILGVAGVSGNGQRELAELILGLRRPLHGIKQLWGEDASRWTIAKIRARGVAGIPDDPLTLAAIPGLSVRENLALGSGKRYHKGVGLAWTRVIADMGRSASRLGFPPPAYDARAAVLSGGNLQRIVLARELAHDPRLIVALYPTRGLDVRSADAVRTALTEARARNAAVLFASEDLDELFAISDRIIALRGGAIAGTFLPPSFTPDLIGRAMVGVADAA